MIEQDHSTIDELGGKLRSLGPVGVRLMVRRTDEEHSLVTGVVDAGRDIARFDEATWDYGHVAFIKVVIDGSIVADWLTDASGEVGGLKFSLPEPSPDCLWIRSASLTYARYGTRFTMPQTEYSVIPRNRTEQSWPRTPLAGVGRPFFLNEEVAAASVLLGDHSTTANRGIPSEMMLVRIAHPEAYIGNVRVSSAAITVPVLGEYLDDVHLQVFSAGDSLDEPVSEPGEITVPVSSADRADAWVVLVRGQECLDFREISSRWPDSLERQGIVYEPDDLNERLDRLRRGGESETVEFKKEFPKGEGIPRTVAAFANGSGGMLIIGVRDDGEIAGIGDDVGAARDCLHNIVRNHVSPPPKYELLTCTLEERTVIAMHVEPGDDRPYGVTGKDGPGPRYYIRRGATTWIAESEELREVCKPRQPRGRDEADGY